MLVFLFFKKNKFIKALFISFLIIFTPFVCHLSRSAVSVDPFYEMLAARKKRISLKKKEEQP